MFHRQIKILLSIWLLLNSINLLAQDTDLRTFNYARADSIALHFPKKKYKTYREIVEPLTADLKTDQEKFRAIFRWITDNIAYSYSNKSPDPNKALTKRKAVCAGYAYLLKEMCNEAGIDCDVIDGWSKNRPEDIGQHSKQTNHAWNEVFLDGNWYLTDVTWASGTYDFKKKKFHKDFDSAYFLPTPDFFIKQHFPRDSRMQKLDTLAKKPPFLKSSVWYKDAYSHGFTVASPQKGHIRQNTKKDFSVTLSINKPISGKDTLQNFYFTVACPKADMVFTASKTIHHDKTTSNWTIELKCKFSADLKDEHEVYLFYGREPISGFLINFH